MGPIVLGEIGFTKLTGVRAYVKLEANSRSKLKIADDTLYPSFR